MFPRTELPRDAVLLMAEQAGVISCTQALALGCTRKVIDRMVRDEHWLRAGLGLYVRANQPVGLIERAWLGHLAAGDNSAIGGEAALALKAARPEPEQVVVVVPSWTSPRLPHDYTVMRDGLDRLAHRRGTLPLIRPEDAILDLAPALSVEGFVGVVTDAAQARLTTPQRVARVLRLRPRMPNRAQLLEVLADLQGIESNLEFIYRRDVERAHGLPRGHRQARGRAGRFDVLYEEYGVVAELDARRGHIDGRFRDYRRDNESAVDMLSTFRYGSHDVRGESCGVAQQLGRALQRRGWPDGPARCPRCREAESFLHV